MSAGQNPALSEHQCKLCRRVGVRGFIEAVTGGWICASSRACDRRVRGTGMVGIGVMRSYVR